MVTRALIYIVTSFGLVYLTEMFGHYGLWILVMPLSTAYLWGVYYFIKLEKEAGRFPSSRNPDKIAVA